MPDSLGARLRQRREEHGIDLIAIAAQTKIKVSLLEGLERDDLTHWPSGIFRRAYIRAYAQSIGMDPDAAVREFQEAHADPDDQLTTQAIASTLAVARAAGGPPTRLRFIMGSALGSLARLRRTPATEAAGEIPGAQTDVPESVAFDLHAAALVADEPPSTPEPSVSAGGPGPVTRTAPDRDDASDDMPPPPSSPLPLESAAHAHDWPSVAELCTRFARVEAPHQVRPLLKETAGLLGASGVIVWIWDSGVDALMPALAFGYSDRVVAHLPGVARDDDNATAAAFRTGRPCTFTGDERADAALTVPLMTPDGPVGVLAIELAGGREEEVPVRATATIIAALLSQLVGHGRAPDARTPPEFLTRGSAEAGGTVLCAAARR